MIGRSTGGHRLMAPVNVDSYAINTGKKTSQNEKGGFEVLRFIFSVIDVPRCAILVFRGSPSQVVLKKNWPPKNVSPFFGAYMKHVVLRFYWPFFRNGKCQKIRPATRGPCK